VWVARGTLFAHAFELQTGETPDEAAARAWQRYRRWTSWVPVVTSGSALWNGILALAFIAFMSTLRKRARRRRQWDEEEVDARDASADASGCRGGVPMTGEPFDFRPGRRAMLRERDQHLAPLAPPASTSPSSGPRACQE